MRAIRRLVLAVVLTVTACAPPNVRTQQAAGMGRLPAPTGVVVEDFAASPEQVRLDQGVSARVQRMSGDVPLSQTQAQVAEEARVTLAQALRAKLASYGLPAMAMPAGGAIPDRTLLVQGQIVAIDEGNRTRRVLIGLGAGRSSVSADAQLYYMSESSRPSFVQSFTANASSGRRPGMAVPLGAEAAAGHVATSAALSGTAQGIGEAQRTSVDEDAVRIADELARQIGGFAEAQGWIPAGSVR
jgi:Domain of unknown function (DUF4410)